jgi:Zn finger protein HypA/HybF involved in hydrogenase expression
MSGMTTLTHSAATHTVREQDIEVECLDCGTYRSVTDLSIDGLGSCPACGYLGWVLAGEVDATELSTLRLMRMRTSSTR